MKNTENYRFNLPEGDDFYSVEHSNENFTAIDKELKKIVDGTQQVGNTKKLNGQEASHFATAESVSNIVSGKTKVSKATTADSATKATKDSNGNDITKTYATNQRVEELLAGIETGETPMGNASALGGETAVEWQKKIDNITDGTTKVGNADKLDGYEIGEFVANENLVINPEFKIGATPVTDATGTKYPSSKWNISSNSTYSAELTENGLKLSQSVVGSWCNLEQILGYVEDGTYTISFWVDKPENIRQVGFNSSGATIVNGGGYSFKKNGNIVTSTYTVKDVTALRLFIQQKAEVCDFTIKWVKVERGAVATPYVTPNENEEKLKCGVTVGDAQTLNGLTAEAFVKRASNTSVTLYVDNVNGLDTNAGTSKDKPLKTMNSNFQTRFSNYSAVTINLLSDYAGDMSLPRHNQVTLQSDDASNQVTVHGAISAYSVPYLTVQNLNVECSSSAIKFDTSSGFIKSVKVLQSESGVVVTQGNVRLQACEINATTRALWAYSVGVVTVMNDVKYTSGNIGVLAQNGSVVSVAQAVINNSTATKHLDYSSGASAGAIFVNGRLQNPVTDADTLDGLDSTAFLQKVGGGVVEKSDAVPFGVKNTKDDIGALILFASKTMNQGYLGFASKDLPVYRATDGVTQYPLHHDGNSARVSISPATPSDTNTVWFDTSEL